MPIPRNSAPAATSIWGRTARSSVVAGRMCMAVIMVRAALTWEPESSVERLTGMRRALRLLAVGSVAVLGCGDDDVAVGTGGATTTTAVAPSGSEQERLDAARARWEE